MTKPSWKKTKQDLVDEKIERMLETYKIIDEVAMKKRAITG